MEINNVSKSYFGLLCANTSATAIKNAAFQIRPSCFPTTAERFAGENVLWPKIISLVKGTPFGRLSRGFNFAVFVSRSFKLYIFGGGEKEFFDKKVV